MSLAELEEMQRPGVFPVRVRRSDEPSGDRKESGLLEMETWLPPVEGIDFRTYVQVVLFRGDLSSDQGKGLFEQESSQNEDLSCGADSELASASSFLF